MNVLNILLEYVFEVTGTTIIICSKMYLPHFSRESDGILVF